MPLRDSDIISLILGCRGYIANIVRLFVYINDRLPKLNKFIVKSDFKCWKTKPSIEDWTYFLSYQFCLNRHYEDKSEDHLFSEIKKSKSKYNSC